MRPVVLARLDASGDQVVDEEADLPVEIRFLAVRPGQRAQSRLPDPAGQRRDDLLGRAEQLAAQVPRDRVRRAGRRGERPVAVPARLEPAEQLVRRDVAAARFGDRRVAPPAGAVRQQLERRAAGGAAGRGDVFTGGRFGHGRNDSACASARAAR